MTIQHKRGKGHHLGDDFYAKYDQRPLKGKVAVIVCTTVLFIHYSGSYHRSFL